MSEVNIASQVTVIEANRTIKDALMEQLKSSRPRKRISVTDLLNVKQAFFRRKYPDIKPPLEKQEVMWAGTGFHEVFGAAVSREEYLEQFVEWEGITGKIDIFKNMPVEVKTTSSSVESAAMVRRRSGYLEQLGMYCGMVNKSEGKLVIYGRDALPGMPSISAFHVTFPDIAAVRAEMVRRRELLEQALASGDASRLPVCPWRRFSCDYSSVCDCGQSRVPSSSEIAALVGEVRSDQVVTAALYDKLSRHEDGAAFGLNDLVFPRKTYLARLRREKPDAGESGSEAEERLTSLDYRGFQAVLQDAVRYALPGGLEQVEVRVGPIAGRVQLNHGMPVMVRVSNLSSPVERDRLPFVSSHYFLRLGFECALDNRPKGRLLIYYRKAASEDAKLMVYDVTFANLETLRAEAERRAELLTTAGNVSQLPPCPAWMCRYCKDISVCCGR